MTTEEKASSYAWSKEVKNGKIKVWHFRDEVHEMLVDAYLAGAAEALRSQWKDAAKELPKECKFVIAHISDDMSDDLEEDAINQGVLNTVAYRRDGHWHFMDEFFYDCSVDRWLPIPPLPDTQEQ